MFDWDAGNVEHIARHNVDLEEIEDALLDPKRLGVPAYDVQGETRWAILGATEAGRILCAVFRRRGGKVRVITARDATAAEKRRYRR